MDTLLPSLCGNPNSSPVSAVWLPSRICIDVRLAYRVDGPVLFNKVRYVFFVLDFRLLTVGVETVDGRR